MAVSDGSSELLRSVVDTVAKVINSACMHNGCCQLQGVADDLVVSWSVSTILQSHLDHQSINHLWHCRELSEMNKCEWVGWKEVTMSLNLGWLMMVHARVVVRSILWQSVCYDHVSLCLLSFCARGIWQSKLTWMVVSQTREWHTTIGYLSLTFKTLRVWTIGMLFRAKSRELVSLYESTITWWVSRGSKWVCPINHVHNVLTWESIP